MPEKTLVLIKPDAVERNLMGAIIQEYERNKLEVTALKMLTATPELAEEHYVDHIGKSFFQDLVTYICRSPLVAMVLEGEDAIKKVREINGATKPDEASPNTIRAVYGLSGSENSVHASDSAESAQRELAIWFPEL